MSTYQRIYSVSSVFCNFAAAVLAASLFVACYEAQEGDVPEDEAVSYAADNVTATDEEEDNASPTDDARVLSEGEMDSDAMVQNETGGEIPRKAPPRATDYVLFLMNLDDCADIPTTPWNMELPTFDPGVASNFSTVITIYDIQGAFHWMDVFLVKTDDDAWSWNALVDAGEVGGVRGEFAQVGNGTLTFMETGELADDTSAAVTVCWRKDAMCQQIQIDFGLSIAERDFESVSSNNSQSTATIATTQYRASSLVETQMQNGFPAGWLEWTQTLDDGSILAVYDNGQYIVVGTP